MKKIFIILVVVYISTSAFSQEEFKRNELRLNSLTTLFLYPEITYERILGNNVSAGISLGWGPESNNWVLTYNVTPFARIYFNPLGARNNNGTGFFIEGSASVYSQSLRKFLWWANGRTDAQTDFGLGVSVGWKFVSNDNWSGEVYTGGVRGFFDDTAHLRTGIAFGRRF